MGMFDQPREQLSDDDLISDYTYLQAEIIRRELPLMPQFVKLSEWSARRTDAWRHRQYCSRMIPLGKLPGAFKLDDEYYVPVGTEPRRKQPKVRAEDGIVL